MYPGLDVPVWLGLDWLSLWLRHGFAYQAGLAHDVVTN